jgi:hypothetical protein
MPWLWSAHDAAHHHQRRYTARTLTEVFTGAGFGCATAPISTACSSR